MMKMQFYDTGNGSSFNDSKNKVFVSNFLTNRQINIKPIYHAPAPEYTPSDGDRITWGKPIWTLFHTLAEKIKSEYFSMVKGELLNMIFTICNNLPCPSCADHATQYMKGVNFNVINNKEQLKDMLFHFHNTVNARKGYKQFPREDLEVTYSSKNTIQVVNEFMVAFEKKNYNIRMTTDNFHRTRAIYRLKNWFSQNFQFFNV
jgi:hypothetical protein